MKLNSRAWIFTFIIAIFVWGCDSTVHKQAQKYIKQGIENSHNSKDMWAIKDFTDAIELEPNNAEAYYQRGLVKEFKDWQGAILDFTKAIELSANNEEYYHRRGYAKNWVKDYEGSIEDFTQTIQINPSNSYNYVDRASEKESIKDYLGALDDYSKAIQLNFKNDIAYLERGLLKVQLGRKESGCVDLRKAGDLGNGSAYEAIQKYCQ